MRILTRYILREVLSYAVLGGVMFTFILFTTRLASILEIFVRGSASLADVLRLIAYFLPEALVVTIPMAVLVGILLGLSRLAADSEITAMRASGMGGLRLRPHHLAHLARRPPARPRQLALPAAALCRRTAPA